MFWHSYSAGYCMNNSLVICAFPKPVSVCGTSASIFQAQTTPLCWDLERKPHSSKAFSTTEPEENIYIFNYDFFIFCLQPLSILRKCCLFLNPVMSGIQNCFVVSFFTHTRGTVKVPMRTCAFLMNVRHTNSTQAKPHQTICSELYFFVI